MTHVLLSSGTRRAAVLVCVNLLAIGAFLGGAEALSRWLGPVELPDALITRGQREWGRTRAHDSLLFWRMRPGSYRKRGWRINSLGLRGDEVPPKARGEYRILSLGESSTFGWHVAEDETYSSLLGSSLPSAEGRPVRVINAGAAGYTLFQGVTYLERRGLALEPDMVMIYFGINDFLKVAFRAERDALVDPESAGITDRRLFERRQRPLARLMSSLRRYSNLARLVSLPRAPERKRVRRGRDRRVPPQDRRWLLARVRQLCLENRIDLVVIIPWYRVFDDHVHLLRETAQWQEVLVIDLPAALAAVPEPLETYFVDRVHPSPSGHREIARVIDSELRARAPWAL